MAPIPGRGPGQVKPPKSVRPPVTPPSMTDDEAWCVRVTDAADGLFAAIIDDAVMIAPGTGRAITVIQAAVDVAVATRWPHEHLTVHEFIEARR